MSKGYYLASLLHVLIRFFYGAARDLSYSVISRFIFYVPLDYKRVSVFMNYILLFVVSIIFGRLYVEGQLSEIIGGFISQTHCN